MSQKILVVEDEPNLLDTLAYNLERNGYEVVKGDNGRLGLDLARQHKPDLVILDLMLPEMDGFDVCRTLRKETDIPILILTAKTDEIDRIVGLEIGADDYISKPFSMRELVARVKAHLRRVERLKEAYAIDEPIQPQNSSMQIRFDNLTIDTGRREVTLNEEPLSLKPKEFELLLYLANNEGIALSREQILAKVWGWEHELNSRTVDVHVRWLRQKIERNDDDPQRIVTVRSIGYRFEG